LTVQFTAYFLATRQRADRKVIDMSWIQGVMDHPTVHNAFFDRGFKP
jgi:hypothetical protein